jgi:membrane associated rhomboid family serine protease
MRKLEIFVYAVCIIAMFKGGITPEFKTQLRILSEVIVYTWSLDILNWLFCGGALNRLGVRPRTSIGLLGIFTSPFLHYDWEHLISNTIAFFILGWFVMLGGIRDYVIITIFIILFKGMGVWLLGRPRTNHFGASGVIFGYLGFLLLRSYFASNFLSIVLTLIVGFFYGRNLLDVLPGEDGISWEGHLFGLMGGILAARFLEILQPIFSAVTSLT